MLELSQINVSFQELRILHDVSLTVEAGETVGIIGPNGSGKTTLFNTISGFITPSAGTLRLKGRDVTSATADDRARQGLGRVFQNFGIFKEMTLEENLLVALEARCSLLESIFQGRATRAQYREQVREYLNQIHLGAKASHKAGSLSGGQMRLLEIVRVFATGADVLLLDEPTSGVSPRMKEEVASLIIRLQNMGKTILVIEHDLNFIQKFCKRIVVLESGRVVLDDSPERVCADERLQEIYFGRKTVGA